MLIFTGTPYQISWKQKIHQVLLKNELGGDVALAYKLSYAGSRSGYSFGYAQWDLARNDSAPGILRDILLNATNASGQYIIQDGDLNTGRNDDTLIQLLMNLAVQPGGASLTAEQRSLINQALSSSYGQNLIDQRHDEHLGEVLVRVDQVISLVSDPDANAFLQTDVAKLFLADYENQFKISPGGALERFVQGLSSSLGGGTVHQVGRMDVSDLLNFYFSTDYARKISGLNDELRRFNSILSVAGGYTLPTDSLTREEEAKGLIRIYQDFLKGKQRQLSNFASFNTQVLQSARNALIGQFVNDAGLGVSINGDVIVGEDQSVLIRNTKHPTDTDLLTGSADNDLIFGESGTDLLKGAGGENVLYGGAGLDLYDLTGDATDHVIDIDGKGALLAGLEDAETFYALATREAQADGSYSGPWTSRDGTVTYDWSGIDGESLTITHGGNAHTVHDYKHGELGLHLLDLPADPQNGATALTEVPFSTDRFQALGEPFFAEVSEVWGYTGSTTGERIDATASPYAVEIVGRGGGDKILGSGLSDYLGVGPSSMSDTAANVLNGGVGSDVLFGGYGNDTVIGGPESDTASHDLLDGGSGNDWLQGGGGNDALFGGDGADLLEGGAGDDWLFANSHAWGARWNWSLTPVTTLLAEAMTPGSTSYSQPVPTHLDYFHDTADPAGDALDGGEGSDYLWGGSGDDYLDGGEGGEGDMLMGHDGSDLLVGRGGGDFLIGGNHDDILYGGAGADWLIGDEIGEFGGTPGRDILVGGSGADLLSGNEGDDILVGGTDDDTLYGGTGVDTYVFSMGDGQDTVYDPDPAAKNVLVFGQGVNRSNIQLHYGSSMVIEYGLADSVQVNGFDPTNAATAQSFDSLVFSDGDSMSYGELIELGFDIDGTAGDDSLVGTSVVDRVRGGAGNDKLWGGDGNDTLHGDDGDDVLSGGNGDGSPSGTDTLSGGAGNDTLFGEDGDDILEGGAGMDQLVGGTGIDALAGGDDDDHLWGEDGDDALTGDAGADTLQGGLGADTLQGGAGDDTLYGEHGDDRYRFALGDGRDRIIEQGDSLGDVLQIAAGIEAGDLVVARRDDDLEIAHANGSDAVTIANWYAAAYWERLYRADYFKLDRVELGDAAATTWSKSALSTMGLALYYGSAGADSMNGDVNANQLYGLEGNDVLSGDAGNDLLAGGAGNDTVYAGAGSDTVVFGRGDGQDSVYTDSFDVLRFGAGITEADLDIYRFGSDIVIGIAGTTDRVTIENFYASGVLLNSVALDGGTVIKWADLYDRGQNHDDIYQYTPGQGAVTIEDWSGADTLQFGAGIAPADITASRSGDNLVLAHANGVDKVIFKGWFANSLLQVETIRFADGTVWSGDSVTAPFLTLTGTGGNDSLHGSDGYADTLNGLGGADKLYGYAGGDILAGGTGNDSLYGGLDNDRYLFNPGDGQDSISDDGGSDRITFGAGFNWQDLVRQSSGTLGENWILSFTGSTDQVTILGQKSAVNAIERIEFTVNGGNNADTLNGSNFSGDSLYGDVIHGYGGNDTINGLSGHDLLYGDDGDDVLDGGSGYDWLHGGAGNDTLGGAYLSVDYEAYSGGNGYIGGAGNDLLRGTARADYYDFAAGDGADTIEENGDPVHIDYIRFGAGIADSAATWQRVGADLVIRYGATDQVTVKNWMGGTAYQVERIEFADGKVWISSDINAVVTTQYGTAADDDLRGVDWYGDALYGLDGNDKLYGYAGNDRLDGGAGNDDLQGWSGDDTLIGADGADLLSGSSGNDALDGGAGNDQLYDDSGNDLLDGGAGDDRLVGSLGNDVYRFGYGYGVDTIEDSGSGYYNGTGGYDAIHFAPGISAADVGYSRSGSDLVLALAGSADRLVIRNYLSTPDYRIEEFVFADGSSLPGAEQIVEELTHIHGTGGDDLLVGSADFDVLRGYEGNDTLVGAGGDDVLRGGPGDDTYVFNAAANGVDRIEDLDGANRVQFGSGVDPAWAIVSLDWYQADDTWMSVEYRYTDPATGLPVDQGFGVAGGIDGVQRYDYADGASRSVDELVALAAQSGNAIRHYYDSGAGSSSSVTMQGTPYADSFDAWGATSAVLYGGGGADTLRATDGADWLYGGAEADLLYGNGGSDVLDGGAGDDRLEGGAGRDTYYFGRGYGMDSIVETGDFDTVRFAADVARADVDIVLNDTKTDHSLVIRIKDTGDTLSVPAFGLGTSAYQIEVVRFGDGTVLTLADLQATEVRGNSRANTLKGTTGQDRLVGEAGNDTLYGYAGNDSLDGGTGNDSLQGGAGNDAYLFTSGWGADTVVENDATAGNLDTLAFGSAIDEMDLVFAMSGTDLVVTQHGSSDSITIQSWGSGTASQVEVFRAADGTTLGNTQVDQLIQAMAQFTATTGLTWDQAIEQRPEDVQAVLAAYWQPAA